MTDTQTWTFFGHWDNDTLVIDHAVAGIHQDLYPDRGLYDGGLWADSAQGASLQDAEAVLRRRYQSPDDDAC